MNTKPNLKFAFSVTLLCAFLESHVSLAADTISENQSLSGDQTIASAGGMFELGFFKPGQLSNYYIGIWYSKQVVSEMTVVWVANREIPVADRFSSVLTILDGNLVLLNMSKNPVWSTDLSSTTSSGSVQAVLLDSGNLVLRAGSSHNTSEPLWQSFDHPTHTWLPGGRLGFNKITDHTQILTSWKNLEDPAPGLYSLKLSLDQSNSYILQWNSCNPSSDNCKCLKGFEPNRQSDWDLQIYSGGCSRKTSVQCANATGDGFLEIHSDSLPENKQNELANSSEMCRLNCLKDCRCTVYAYGSTIGCLIWHGDVLDLKELDKNDGVIKSSLLIAIVSPITGLLLVIFGYFLWKKTLGNKRAHRNRYGETRSKLAAGGEKNDGELPIFGLRAIIAATNNFAEANKLGEGGFGPVYKVTLPLYTLVHFSPHAHPCLFMT
ncbi:hypothetical protein DVH24_032225 [Malus domestica]|uniref:Bulb-type lectin domain-containing protein n=1 Tax=Malus domestica TaxID=3750 RepID=A0A498J2T4_MALDO|nr:hypothetical protein DVH24_032225 [Malus domestica]